MSDRQVGVVVRSIRTAVRQLCSLARLPDLSNHLRQRKLMRTLCPQSAAGTACSGEAAAGHGRWPMVRVVPGVRFDFPSVDRLSERLFGHGRTSWFRPKSKRVIFWIGRSGMNGGVRSRWLILGMSLATTHLRLSAVSRSVALDGTGDEACGVVIGCSGLVSATPASQECGRNAVMAGRGHGGPSGSSEHRFVRRFDRLSQSGSGNWQHLARYHDTATEPFLATEPLSGRAFPIGASTA